MAHDPRDEEEYEEREARRPSGPRFGPFVTIAMAILMLFGAASRVGKTSEDGGWFNFDFLASRSLERERLRQQEQRNTTLITLGAIPAPAEDDISGRRLRLNEDVVQPQRDVDYYGYLESRERRNGNPVQLSLPLPIEDNRHPGSSESAPRFDPAPEAKPPVSVESAVGGTYVVAQGDNWVKIGKQTGKRWQDIQKANPQTQSGLRVGMKLIIP